MPKEKRYWLISTILHFRMNGMPERNLEEMEQVFTEDLNKLPPDLRENLESFFDERCQEEPHYPNLITDIMYAFATVFHDYKSSKTILH